MSNKLHISQFHKSKSSLYKLTNNQIKHLIHYITHNCSQEELNDALGYTSNCPYCNSKDFYKTNIKSNLYKFQCQQCSKQFNILSGSPLADLLSNEAIKQNNRFTHKDALKNIEVWLHFDIEHDRKYNSIPRRNSISTVFRWRHHLFQIPQDIKKDHLVNIHERDQESFHRLIDNQAYKSVKKKNKSHSKKKFIILTYKEGEYILTKPISALENPFNAMSMRNSPIENYKAEDNKKKFQLEYDNLKDTLIKSYNEECETLDMPNRDDEIYKNIENPYKHTYSLAYEMAIRNEEVKKILYALEYLKNIKENLQLITSKYIKDKDSSVAISYKASDTYDSAMKEYKERLASIYSSCFSEEVHHQYLSVGVYKINTMIDDFEEELRKEYLIVPKDKKIVTPEASRILMQRIIHNSIDPKKYKWKSEHEQELKYKFEEKEYDDYTISMGVLEGDDVFDVNIIRPTFDLHVIDKNTSLVPINFTLETEEIVAFIEKIKEDLKKDGNLIKTPMELLGEELEKIDEAEVKQYLPKTFNNNLIAMANALFAFDVFKHLTHVQNQLKTERDKLTDKLDNELLVYKKSGRKTAHEKRMIQKIEKKHAMKIQEYEKKIDVICISSLKKYLKISKKINVSESTTERYIKFMDEYIEGKKYKKLFIKTR